MFCFLGHPEQSNCWILVSESPETNRWISQDELDFIVKNRDEGKIQNNQGRIIGDI